MAKGGYIQTSINSNVLEAKLKKLSSQHRKEASYAAAKYLVGTPSRGLKRYPAYKHITRKRAYGKTFQSARQRRYVMAKIRSGEIDPGAPKRTGRMQRGWKAVRTRSGARISNAEPHAIWSHDNQRQARLNKLAGWRITKEIAETNRKGMNKAAEKVIGELVK